MVFEVEKKLQHDSAKMIELIRRGDHDWMLPHEWEQWYLQIRKTYQYIQMKIKLFFIYEERDNGIILTF